MASNASAGSASAGSADFDYIVVGAGIAGNAAVRGIRSNDKAGSIAIVGAEPVAPYARPALSKALWRDADATPDSIALGDAEHTAGVSLRFGTEATAIDAAAHTVATSTGTLGYRKLILTTGGAPRSLGTTPDDRIIAFRTLDDYRALRSLAEARAEVLVIGGGYIGTELAAALRIVGTPATFAFPQEHVGAAQFPPAIAEHLDSVYREHGVRLLPGTRIAKLERSGGGVIATTENAEQIRADAAVLGLGIEPRVGLAKAAGLAIGDGVEVDAQLRTSDPDIYAAGDIASWPDPVLGDPKTGRRRVEHEDAANTQGETAGRNAAGEGEDYTDIPFYYSDLFDDGYEAVGKLDSSLQTVVDWKSDGEAVVYYLDDEHRVRGVLFWNVWGDDEHDTKALGRALLRDGTPHDPESLLGRI